MGRFPKFVELVCFALSLAISLPCAAADVPEKAVKNPNSGGSSLNCIQTSDKGATELDESCSIAVGVIDVREYDFPPHVTVGNESLLQSKEGSSSNQIRLIPLKKGTTSVLVEDRQGGHRQRIVYNITTNDLSSKVESIRQLLSDVEGITIRSLDDKIVLDGELIVPHDYDRILQVQQAYADSVLNLVSLSRISRDAIAKRMQTEINNNPGGANVTVRVMNETFFLNGKVDSQADKDNAELIAKTYLPDTLGSLSVKEGALVQNLKKFAIQDLIVTEEAPPPPAPKMVRVTYHFVEISKEYLRSSFFKWAPLLNQGAGIQIGQSTTGGVAASGGGSFVGTISNLFPKLQSGTTGGFARVLYSTVMLGLDKEKTTLDRSDSVPYQSGFTTTGVPITQVAKAGLHLDTTPTISGEDKVQLKTSFNFSAFIGSTNSTRGTTLSNEVIVKSGDSAVLGGLISNNIAKDVGQDPTAAAPAGDPLFNLLRSKSFKNSKTQFVVFITPKIVEDAAEGTADIKAKIINTTKKRQRTIQ